MTGEVRWQSIQTARLVVAGLFGLAAFLIRPIVRDLDPTLAVQAAVLHDKDGPDPWGQRWRIVAGYHDSSYLPLYSSGPDGVWLNADDVVPVFFFWGWGLHDGWDGSRWSFPPEVFLHNLYISKLEGDLPGLPLPDVSPGELESLREWPQYRSYNRDHVIAALVGWSRELGLAAGGVLLVAPIAYRHVRTRRSTTPVELLRASLLAIVPAALAAGIAVTWIAPRSVRSSYMFVSPSVACAVSAMTVVWLALMLWRLSRPRAEPASSDSKTLDR